MTDFPYSTLDLTGQEIKEILSIFRALENKFDVNFKMELTFPFEQFSLFENYSEHSIGPVIDIRHQGKSFYMTFTEVSYSMANASRYPLLPRKEYQTWCLLSLKRPYGHILVKTETVLDKIHELFHPIEIDFREDAEFSKQFYVLASDELPAKSLLNSRFRSCLKQLRDKDACLEVSSDKLIVGNKKRIEKTSALEMADLLLKLLDSID